MGWTPVLFLSLLVIFFKRPALELSLYGTGFTLILVAAWFDTPFSAAIRAGVDGILTTLPLVLVIFAGILLSSMLMAVGALTRVVDWFMAGVRDGFHRNVLISLGVCNFMEGAGVIAEPIVAPMLHAAGVAPAGAAALSIIGYSGLLTLEMAGITITVLSLITGISINELGLAIAWLSIPATVAMALCLPIFLPRPWPNARRWLLLIFSGLLLGFTALAAVAYLAVSISGMVAGLVLIFLLLSGGMKNLQINRSILRDLAPFLFLLIVLLLVNTVPPLKDLTFRRLAFKVSSIPVHAITFRPFFSAYLYLFLACLLVQKLFNVSGHTLRDVLRGGFQKAWRASVAMAMFGAMGQIIAYSGYDAGFAHLNQTNNVPWVIANGLAGYTGSLYPVFVPLLGWVGTFLSGYGVASLMLFGKLQVEIAAAMNISATWLVSGLAVGASIGSISSPFKIAIAAPMCGAMGRESGILRLTIPLGVAASMLVGLILFWIL
jgi:lactate permease